MDTGTKVMIGVLVTATIVGGYFIYKSSTPPTLTVRQWDGEKKIAQVEFGSASFSTEGNAGFSAGHGWSIDNKGNDLTVYKNGKVYKTVTVTATGPIKL
jgi:hypothetical protein